jgi:Bifunctional DNA primase/polymerase, N-terminal
LKLARQTIEERQNEKSAKPVPECKPHGESMIAMPTPSPNSADLPIEVRQAASRRWRLFPVQALSRFGPASAQFEVATCDLNALERLANECHDCNWALATGQASGVFVLEVSSECGRTALHSLSEEEWDCEETLQSRAGNIRYAFFRWPDGMTICNEVIAPGLKIHWNDYVPIPPSKHFSGVSHTYLNPEADIATTPRWLLNLAFQELEGKSPGKVLPFPIVPPQWASAVRAAESSCGKILPFETD